MCSKRTICLNHGGPLGGYRGKCIFLVRSGERYWCLVFGFRRPSHSTRAMFWNVYDYSLLKEKKSTDSRICWYAVFSVVSLPLAALAALIIFRPDLTVRIIDLVLKLASM